MDGMEQPEDADYPVNHQKEGNGMEQDFNIPSILLSCKKV